MDKFRLIGLSFIFAFGFCSASTSTPFLIQKNANVQKAQNLLKPQSNERNKEVDKTQVKTIDLKDNETVRLALSTHNPNRLFVKGEKITQASCQQSYCVASYDQSGGVYISLGYPARLTLEGFSIFIETDSGQHFSIIAYADNKAVGKTIEFRLAGGSKKAMLFEKKNPYQSMLIKLTKSMINYHDGDDLDDGLSTSVVNANVQKNSGIHGVLIIPVRTFRADHFIGFKYLVKNLTDNAIPLYSSSFYTANMVSGALLDDVLKPKSSSYFYAVYEVNQDD